MLRGWGVNRFSIAWGTPSPAGSSTSSSAGVTT